MLAKYMLMFVSVKVSQSSLKRKKIMTGCPVHLLHKYKSIFFYSSGQTWPRGDAKGQEGTAPLMTKLAPACCSSPLSSAQIPFAPHCSPSFMSEIFSSDLALLLSSLYTLCDSHSSSANVNHLCSLCRLTTHLMRERLITVDLRNDGLCTVHRNVFIPVWLTASVLFCLCWPDCKSHGR